MRLNEIKKILLVEDFSLLRNLERTLLGSLSCNNIIEAENGDDAINILNKNKDIDLIISDWDMPNKNGITLLEWVRNNSHFSKTPFLMLANRGDRSNVEKALKSGANSFIAKPFTAEELKNKIEEAFGEKKQEDIKQVDIDSRRKTDSGKVKLKVGHLPITDHVILGVVRHFLQKGKWQADHFELDVVSMPTWNSVSRSLEKGVIDAAFVLAPIAMDLFSYNTPIKLILFAHKNGSIFVRNRQGGKFQQPYEDFFSKRSFLIPHIMSVHHMLAHIFFSNINLKPGEMGNKNVNVNFEVIPLPKMHEFLGAGPDSCGFFVAEPLGTKAIASGLAELMFLSSEIWENHPCCVVTMQNDFIEKYPDAVFEFTNLLVKAGEFIEQRPGIAAEIAVDFLDPKRTLGLKVPLLKNVLSEPLGIKTGDLYPSKYDLDRIQKYMHEKMGIGTIIDLDKFVDLRFAEKSCKSLSEIGSNLHDNPEKSIDILQRQASEDKSLASKSVLNKVGKYLALTLRNQQFGIDIAKIKEIIGIIPIRTVPMTPKYVKGVIDLRGNVIPVIDLRLKLGMEAGVYDERSCIIVLEVESTSSTITLGVAVDTVAEVMDVKADDIEEAPSMGLDIDAKYILAMAKSKNDVKILLDIDNVINS